MDESSLWEQLAQQLIVIVPVLVGGLLTVVGGLVAPFIESRIKRRDTVQRIKREQLENLLEEAYKISDWLTDRQNAIFSGLEDQPPPPPIHRVEIIQTLYFNELKQEVSKLSVAESKYRVWVTKLRKAFLEAKKEGQNLPPDEELSVLTEELDAVHPALLQAITEVRHKAATIMNELRRE